MAKYDLDTLNRVWQFAIDRYLTAKGTPFASRWRHVLLACRDLHATMTQPIVGAAYWAER